MFVVELVQKSELVIEGRNCIWKRGKRYIRSKQVRKNRGKKQDDTKNARKSLLRLFHIIVHRRINVTERETKKEEMEKETL